jgi:hypothetical protein
MNATAVITAKTTVDDYVAARVVRMAEKFYADPENVRKYAEWHLKEYGCLPDDAKNADKKPAAGG